MWRPQLALSAAARPRRINVTSALVYRTRCSPLRSVSKPRGPGMSHPTARDSVMLQVPNVGAFVRSLLPVHL
jgi:hypothetical protein